MGNKNKTVSFRLNEDTFEALQAVAEERDLSLSAVFRDYVDALVAHDGHVEVVPEGASVDGEDGDGMTFPPTVEVPKSFVREHERLELEAEHLREQLEEHKRYISHLQERLDGGDDADVVDLDSLDEAAGRHREGERERDYEAPADYEF
jgi:hypothetical protein